MTSTLYQVSRTRRFLELVIQPWLAMGGVAMVAYTAAKAWPHVGELRDLLRHGWVAWVAAAPVALVLVPFLLKYASICARAVARCWLDAISNDTVAEEGTVTLATTDRFAFVSGRTPLIGAINRMSVGGRMFTTVPENVLKQIRVDDRVRVTYTPRVQYVVALDRIEG
jgi:hypothetical protein